MADISESDLKVFVDAVTHYFVHLTQEAADVRAAYLLESSTPHFAYTGLITISGRFRGCVHFSAGAALLRELLKEMGETNIREPGLLDAVGEIANTIAGNARRHFSEGLEISVPVTIRGACEQVKAAARARPFAILLRWRSHEGAVIVDLEAT